MVTVCVVSSPPADTITESEISITAELLFDIDKPKSLAISFIATPPSVIKFPPSLSTKSPQVDASAALEGGNRHEIL